MTTAGAARTAQLARATPAAEQGKKKGGRCASGRQTAEQRTRTRTLFFFFFFYLYRTNSLGEHGHVGVGPLQGVHEREHPLRHRREQRGLRRVKEDASLLQYRRKQLEDALGAKRPARTIGGR